MTLRGEIRERIPKTAGAEVGTITEGRTTGCRAFGFVEARVTIEAERGTPIRKRFNVILGTLPNITGILFLDDGVRATVVSGGRTCRYEGRWGLLIVVVRGQWEQLIQLLQEIIVVAGSSPECPREGSFRGSMRFERTRTVTLV